MVGFLFMAECNFGVSIKEFGSLMCEQLVTFEPFFEPHSTHHIIVRHGIETVEGVLDTLSGSSGGLK